MLRWLKQNPPASEDASRASAEQLLQRGNACLGQGQLTTAEKCYREAIDADPARTSAKVNLGYVLIELQRIDEAARYLSLALATDSANPDAHYLLGTLAAQRGDAEAAAGHFEAALVAKPDFEFALRDLCQLLMRTGQHERACTALDKGIAASQESANLYCYKGNVKVNAAQYEVALDCFGIALSTVPEHSAALSGSGLALKGLGRPEEAATAFTKALAVDPNNAEAHYNLGLVLQSQGRLDEAVQCYRRAIGSKLDMAEAWNGLGSAFLAQSHFADSAESYRQAIKLKPDLTEAHCNLGYALHMLKQPDQAVACYRKALELESDYVPAHNNLSLVLAEQGLADEAIEGLHRAVKLKPDDPSIRLHLGCVLRDAGRLDESIEQFRQAQQLQPDGPVALDNTLFIMTYDASYSPDDYVREARRYGRLLTAQARQSVGTSPAPSKRSGDILRVGLVSGDLRDHPVGYFLENVLSHLDPGRIDLVAYPTTREEGQLTARIRPHFSLWRPLVGLDDHEAADRIRDDGIDILIDLAGHTANNRLSLFAWKPAPVQVTWLGYWASTGVAEIDFILADPVSVPASCESQFTEAVWRLPDTRLCPSPLDDSPAVAPLPALENRHLTFGTYQHLSKLNDSIFALWARIFAALPDARLRIQNKQLLSRPTREQLLANLARHGISGDRVDMYGHADRIAYLESYEDVDIILDTFPYPGGTTTCEALWMGVPTLTLAGNTMLSRQGASLLACVGLCDWIANDADQYVELAIKHAADFEALAMLRQSMREQSLASPLFDGPRFARNLEQALFGMWRQKTER